MRNRRRAWSLVALALFLGACGGRSTTQDREAHGEHGGEHEDHAATGPHGGQILRAEGLELELVLAAEDGPPAFKGYLHDDHGKGVPLTSETLVVTLERLGGRRDTIHFRIDGDHLHGTEPVEEPHSFAATVELTRGGRAHRWSFEQRESRIELLPEAIQTAGIVTGQAGPSRIEVTVEAPGEVRLNAERVVQVRPRYPGAVRALHKRLGQAVRRDEVLALVHSNESLAEYPITAPMNGTVVGQESAVGQAVDHESILYVVADLSSVWVDFPIYPQSAGQIRPGQRVRIRSASGPPLSSTGTIRYVGPLLEQDTRVSYGRVVLDNRSRDWQPGLYVTAAVTVQEVEVAVAVPEDAIVRMADGPAVFRAAGNRFEPQPVVVGRSDGRMTEIVSGLEPGARIVVTNAFLLKAELGKSEAGHEH